MTPDIIDTPEGPPDLPRIPGTRQSLHALARVTHSLPRCKNPLPLEPKSSGKENLNTGCGNESPTTFAAAKMKFTIPFPNDNNATKGAYFSSSSTTRRVITIKGWSCDKCTLQHRYHAQISAMCNANRNDEDKDGNATGAYSSSSSSTRSAMTTTLKREWTLGDEKDCTTKKRPSSPETKSSVHVDERKLAAKPYTTTTGVVVELTVKEKRATNKKIKEEVLQKITQCKAVLSVPYAFGMEHWKVLLSQMENGGDYTNQLFFGKSRDSQS